MTGIGACIGQHFAVFGKGFSEGGGNADIMGEKAFGEEWSVMKDAIEEMDDKQVADYLYSIKDNNAFSNEQKASLFALHSQEESQGIALVEAMAVGLPVVSTTVGGIPFVVKDGETGLLSMYGDVDAFADNLIKLLKNDDLRKRMSQDARNAAQSYSWQNLAKA